MCNSAFREGGFMEQTIRNYIEGWYDKDTLRIQQAMHPLLVKQGIMPDAGGDVRKIDLQTLLEVTPLYGGDKSGTRTLEMKILATDGDIASAMVISNEYVDYLHLVHTDGQWMILNVLWEFRSGEVPELSPEEMQKLEKPLRDYVEGWYDKDPGRVGDGLHQNLAKRSLNTENPGTIDQFTRSSLLEVVTQYGGPGGTERFFEMEVLDSRKDMASVKLTSNAFVDFIHVARTDGTWKILNVLWKWK